MLGKRSYVRRLEHAWVIAESDENKKDAGPNNERAIVQARAERHV